jgi:magnesium chelatase family protein
LRPGEISLAHQGVLFLDELPEFDRRVLEALREPLENGRIALARATGHLTLPARFQLIAAMNPCACGYLGDTREACRCSGARMQRYRQRLSGPLLDRIDIRVCVERLSEQELMFAAGRVGASSGTQPAGAEDDDESLRGAVLAAREYRRSRSGAVSAALTATQLRHCCVLTPDAAQVMQRSAERWPISGRGAQRLLALSRTIADLAGSDIIQKPHMAEALQLRRPLELQ